MRVLRLDLAPGEVLDLHPDLSIVTDLDPERRGAVLDRLVALARARADGGPGLVETHGLLVPAASRWLDVLGVPTDVDVLLRWGDLPGVVGATTPEPAVDGADDVDRLERARDDAAARVAAATAALDHARGALDDYAATAHEAATAALAEARELVRARRAAAVPAGAGTDTAGWGGTGAGAVTDELDRTRRTRAELEERLDDDRRELLDLLEELDDARRELAGAEAALVTARAELADLDAAADAAERAVADARAAATTRRDDADVAEAERVEAERVEAERVEAERVEAERRAEAERVEAERRAEAERVEAERRADHEAAIERHAELVAAHEAARAARGELAAAVEAVRAARDTRRPDPAAAALADALAEHRARAEALDRAFVAEGLDAEGAHERLEAARAEVVAAEEGVRPRQVDPERAAALEALHDELVELDDKRQQRFGGRAAQKRYEEVHAELAAEVEALGFTTYTDYVMTRTGPTVDAAARRRLEVAHADLEVAEAAWRDLSERIERDPRRAILAEEGHQVRQAVAARLGDVPDDAEARLRAETVAGEVDGERLAALQQALGAAGGDDGEADVETLVARAEALLATPEPAPPGPPPELAAPDPEPEPHEPEPHDPGAHDAGRTGTEPDGDPAGPDAESAGLVTDGPEAWGTGADESGEDDVDDEPEVAAARVARDAAVAARAVAVDALVTVESAVDEWRSRASALESAARRRDDALTALEDEADGLDANLTALERELELVRAEADAAEVAADDGDDQDAEIAVDGDPTVLAARRALESAERRLHRHREAVAEVDRAHAQLDGARADERRATDDLETARAAREAAMAATAAGDWDDARDLDEIEWSLFASGSALRSVSVAGAAPLVLDDPFRGLPEADVERLAAALARMAETVQVIYVGDPPGLAGWVERRGLDVGAVVRPGPPVD